MDAKLRSLWWKEWREQRWKAAFGAVIVGSFTAIGLKTRIVEDAAVILISTLFMSFVFSILVAMGCVAADRAEGSLGTLIALPERPGRILSMKLFVAAVVFAIPICVACAAALIVAGGREISSGNTILMHACMLWVGLQVIVWTLALGIRAHTEGRLAGAAIAIAIVWLAWALIQDGMLPKQRWLWAIHPMYAFDMFSDARTISVSAFVCEVVEVAVLLILVKYRFNRLAEGA